MFLGYAAGKAVLAAQDRLGFPGGPRVSAAAHERYARQVMDVTTAQWAAVVTGLVAAVVVLATVTAAGRRVPPPLMAVLLAVLTAGTLAGASIMVLDGLVGLGIGWSWQYGVVGLLAAALTVTTAVVYARAVWPLTGWRASAQRSFPSGR